MPTPPNLSMIFGIYDVHLIGKILDVADDELLKSEGFTEKELVRAKAIFEDLDKHLNRVIARTWNALEVA